MRITKYASIALAISMIMSCLFSCQHDSLIMDVDPQIIDTMEEEIDTMLVSNPCNPDSIYFKNDVFPIFQTNCAFSGCHGGNSSSGGVDLSNYQSIMETAKVEPYDLNGSNLYRYITESDSDKIMPPAPYSPLSSDQILIIAQWILTGSPNNECDDCSTTDIRFGSVIAPIIQNNCEGCHGINSPSAGIPLTNHIEIQIAALNGSLLGTINSESGYVPMPYNLPSLDSCQIGQIKIWIDEGALDN